jgi:hypothetical protein
VFRGIGPAQQLDLLALARRQGLLYFHQLPPPANGHRTEPAPDKLGQFLLGRIDDLAPVSLKPAGVQDELLDREQREAVARGLQTPDLCLIRGGPGTGKSRVVAELIVQATARGERVLLVAPSTAALDRVLERVSGSAGVLPVRCPAPDENPATLRDTERQLTFAEQAAGLQAQACERARASLAAGSEQLHRLQQDTGLWPQFEELAHGWQQLLEQGASLEERRSGLPGDVERDAGPGPGSMSPGCVIANPVAAAVGDVARQRDEALAILARQLAEQQARIEECRRQLQKLDTELQALRPAIEVKTAGRWWTAAWWLVLFKGKVQDRYRQLDSERKQTENALATQERQFGRLQEERLRATQAATEQRARILEVEVNRRRQELSAQAAAVAERQQSLKERWQVLCSRLAADCPRPVNPSWEHWQKAQHDWQQLLAQVPQQVELTRQWLDYLEKTPEALAAYLRQGANLVALPAAALATDPEFGSAAFTEPPGGAVFDLLIFEEAERITESDLLQAARRARRWILVADADSVNGPPQAVEMARAGHPPAGPRLALPLPCVFERLWGLLHSGPSRLAYVWKQEKDRLQCRLRSIPADINHYLETEHVADHPEIELQILTLPGHRPELAEIHFPPGMALEKAKQFVLHELEEVAVQASAPHLRWTEASDRLVLRLAEPELAHDHIVDLGLGVREMVGRASDGADSPAPSTVYPTCCLEFDRSAGWGRDRAEDWVARYLGLRDLGRTAELRVCHRMSPRLGEWFRGLLPFAGYGAPASNNGADERGSAFEFVPVPAVSRGPELDRSSGTRGRPAPGGSRLRGGAGLEVDLADSRQRDRLPLEHRSHLPSRGHVNYLEAQAVVRRLARLGQEAADGKETGSVAVIAFSAGQAALIRRLVEQDALLRSASLRLRIDVASGFRQDEADLVLVSLTRSHTHRAVAFAASPEELILALTRGRSRLIVFGDHGTVARRLQWEGALEGLDAGAADRERGLLSHLLPPGCSAPPPEAHPAPLRQGGRA